MTETVFAADPARLLIAAAAGILLLLLLIIKFKIHPGIVSADLCTGYRAWSRDAGSDAGKHCRKRCRRNLTGNHTPDRTGLSVRWDIGSVGWRTVRCSDTGKQVW